MSFDALDYFQAHRAQERIALRTLEEAKAGVDASRSKLEQAEIQLITKKKQSTDARKKLAGMYSTNILTTQVDLLANRADLAIEVEKKTFERGERVQDLLKRLEDESFSAGSDSESDEQKQFEQANSFIDHARKRIQVLQSSKDGLAQDLQALKDNNSKLEAECQSWQTKLEATSKDLEITKEQINRTRERISHVQQDTERSIANADRIWKERLAQAQAELQKSAEELRKRAENIRTEDGIELEKLRAAIRACEEQQNLLEGEKQRLAEKLKGYSQEMLLQVDDPTSMPDLQALKVQVEEERESIRKLRESLKPQSILWEERQKLEEARFLPMHARLIDPKREELLGLKRSLREAEENNVLLHDKYQKIMESLDGEVTVAGRN